MAELGIALASKLIGVVGSDVIRDICSMWGYKSQLDDLKDTITTVRHVLLDAESKDGQLGHEAQDYIRKLKNAFYDADDLFDEFLTLAELKQHDKGSKLSKKVHDFFSPWRNSLSVAYPMSREVKKIQKKLDSVASNHNTFGFSIDSQPIRYRREETCSYVYKDEVVGREGDVDKVVHMLLDSGSQERVSFLSIVGIGGLGKTTLAQFVFNDDRVKSEFPLRLWTCVSDGNATDFDVKKILADILESAYCKNHGSLSMDVVQSKLGGLLGGKKYLIVLDDLWNEDRDKWLGLRKFLMMGEIGSRVLVTTRSERTAVVVDEYKYELRGLSQNDSWRLFEITAFGEKEKAWKGIHDENFSELVKLGKEIVEKCSNLPLAIRVVGTLLYGQNVSKWRLIREFGLSSLTNGENKIMSILKLSYDNLESPLKVCFTYCSLFPKDFKINKEKLIRLWMAQGYIVPFDVGQSVEDAAEEYFSILLRRCFFQGVEMNEFGGVQSFRIHDLHHDVAQKVAGKDAMSLNSIPTQLGDDVHHFFHVGSKCKGNSIPKCKIRSYVRDGFQISFPVVKLVENCKFLRTLDLHDLDIQVLPDSVGRLLHLRYLDSKFEEGYLRRMKHLEEIVVDFLGHENHKSWLEKLEPPSSLQALILNGYREKALPTKWWHGDATLSTFLPNLVRLSISSSNLMHLPSLSKLLHLKSLSFINLGKLEYMEDTTYGTDAFTFFPSLECLKLSFMNDLKQWWKSGEVKCNVRQPSFVKLSELSVEYCRELVSFPACPRLEKLKLVGVNKEFRMSFGVEEGWIKLREVEIENLGDLQSLPTQSLTSLCIRGYEELENSSELGDTFFKSCSSLRSLEIMGYLSFGSLHGWWKHLTTLQSLKLQDIPMLTFSRHSSGTNDSDDDNGDDDGIPWRFLERSLRSLQFKGLHMKILPKGMRHLTSLLNLDLVSCEYLEYLPEWLSCLSSLQSLHIINCRRLKSLPYQVRDLTSLQLLHVRWCPLVAEQFRDINGNEWLNLRHISTVDIRADQITAQD